MDSICAQFLVEISIVQPVGRLLEGDVDPLEQGDKSFPRRVSLALHPNPRCNDDVVNCTDP